MATVQEAIRRLTIEASTRGVKEAEQATRGLSDAVDGVAVSSQRAERATQSMEGRLASIRRKYDEQYRAQMEMKRVENALIAAQVQGLVTMQDRMELLALAAQRHGLASAAIAKEAAATNHLAAATRNLAVANDNSARFRRQNLTYQLFDIGQSAYGGINPAMIAAQQGPQILQLYSGAGGVNAALKDTASLLGGVASRFGPVAVAAGVAALAIKGIQDEINEASKVQVTFGDVAKATWQVAAAAIERELRPAVRAVSTEAESAWSGLRDAAGQQFNGMVIVGRWAFETLVFSVASLPDAFVMAGHAAANGFVGAIEWMVNQSLAGIRSITQGLNDFVNAYGGDLLRTKLGWDLTIPDIPAITLPRIDAGGEAAMKRMAERAGEYQKTVAEIVRTDHWGATIKAIGGQAAKNAVARLEEAAKATKGAGRAAREARAEYEAFTRTADRLAEKMFPGEYARKEAEELTASLAAYGDKLSDIQRLAVEARIADQFEAARRGVRELAKETEKASDEMAKALASTFSDLFTQPMKDLDAFMDKITGGLAQIGTNNLQSGLEGLLSGKGFGPANDNDRWASLREVGKAVEKGALAGTRDGAQNWLGSLFGGKLPDGAMKNISAGLGGFGMGYQAQDPAMGGIGGALSGFMAGGPIGAVVGGIGGLLGGLFGGSSRRDKERKEARQSLWDNAASVRSTLDRGLGRGAGNYRSEFAEYEAEAMKIRRTAMKAGNWAMEREAREAISRFRATLKSDFRSAFDGTVEAMRSGLGSNSPFVQAQQSVIGLRDELKNFIADAKWAGESTRVATRAARDYALSQLAGAKELSPMETEMQRIRGTAAGLRNTLKELGMNSSQADKAIRDGLVKAVAGLRDQYRTDVRGSINELSGRGYLNEMADAQKLYNERLKDAKALGLSASLANKEFSLSIASIAMQSGLTGKQLRHYADHLDIPARLLKGILKDLNVQNAEKWSSTISDLRLRRVQAVTDTSGLSGQLKLFDMQAKLERQRLKEAGATGAALVALDRATGAERIRLIKEFNKQQVALQRDFGVRYLQATVDASGLDGQLRLFDMQAQMERQRLKESGATAATLVALDRATGAERILLIKEFNKQQIAQQQDFNMRYAQATVDASGLDGQLKLFDMQAKLERQRLKESGATAATLLALDRATGAERILLIKEFNKQQIAQQQDLAVRLAQATTDASGLDGQLKLFDMQAKLERQRLKESGAVTATLTALEKALAAERQKLIDDFNRQKIDEAKSALDEALGAFRNFAKGLREFRDGLRLDSNLSTLSAEDRLTEARRQYEDTLKLAMGGDRDAMDKLTSISQTYLTEAKDYFASTEQYAAIFNSVNAALAKAETSATSQVTAAEQQITLLSKQVSTLASVDKTLLTVSQLTKELTTSVTKYLTAGGKPFSSGGYTGDLGVHQVAGVVHGREFVANASTTARYRPQLEAMQAGTYRPQQIVTNDNRAGFRELATVFAAGQSKMIEALKEELAEVRGELRRLTNETRISGDKKSRITAAGR